MSERRLGTNLAFLYGLAAGGALLLGIAPFLGIRCDFKQEGDGEAEVQVTGGSTNVVNGDVVPAGDKIPPNVQPNGQNSGTAEGKERAFFTPMTQGPKSKYNKNSDLAAEHRVQEVKATATTNVTLTGTLHFSKKKFILEDVAAGKNQF